MSNALSSLSDVFLPCLHKWIERDEGFLSNPSWGLFGSVWTPLTLLGARYSDPPCLAVSCQVAVRSSVKGATLARSSERVLSFGWNHHYSGCPGKLRKGKPPICANFQGSHPVFLRRCSAHSIRARRRWPKMQNVQKKLEWIYNKLL